ncbi:hypothetical protein [Streptomyces capillispiralis]|uniref:Uncharacterized protein n=1 Tax=Streptomyces capillispiralis TaxID=68182 RepID=A0A561TQE6_9ACTN|nr:hypothetical protein [Streptomyces capillispiralis]TWF89337.1 hypothetical protein FHX78_116379 [Streptomyces capillispiralis]
MFDEDGSLDPLLKFLLYAVIVLAVGKMLWEWLTEDVGQWITVDLWGLIADHPWWTGLFVVGGVSMLLLLPESCHFCSAPTPTPARTTRSPFPLAMRSKRTR